MKEIVFTIDVTNNELDGAPTGVSLSGLLPSGYSYVSSSVLVGNYDEFTGIWNIMEMLKIQKLKTMTITAIVDSKGEYKDCG